MAVKESRLEEMKLALDLSRPVYEEAIRRQSGLDPNWGSRRAQLEEKVCRSIARFGEDDAPHKAVFIIGSLQAHARELMAPADIITKFEAEEKAYKMYKQEIDVKTATGVTRAQAKSARAQARAAGMTGAGVRI